MSLLTLGAIGISVWGSQEVHHGVTAANAELEYINIWLEDLHNRVCWVRIYFWQNFPKFFQNKKFAYIFFLLKIVWNIYLLKKYFLILKKKLWQKFFQNHLKENSLQFLLSS